MQTKTGLIACFRIVSVKRFISGCPDSTLANTETADMQTKLWLRLQWRVWRFCWFSFTANILMQWWLCGVSTLPEHCREKQTSIEKLFAKFCWCYRLSPCYCWWWLLSKYTLLMCLECEQWGWQWQWCEKLPKKLASEIFCTEKYTPSGGTVCS